MHFLTRYGMDETDGLSLETKTVWGGMAIQLVADDGTVEAILMSTMHP